MRRRFLLILLAAAGAAGCGSEAGNEAQGAGDDGPPPGLTAQPVKEEHRSLALTPQWLAGRWQTQEGDCSAGDTFLTFNPDGSYSYLAEGGRWSLAGDALTIEITEPAPEGGSNKGDKHSNKVTPIGPNEAEFDFGGDRPPIRIFRCHGG
jgi:hypothetical protein